MEADTKPDGHLPYRYLPGKHSLHPMRRCKNIKQGPCFRHGKTGKEAMVTHSFQDPAENRPHKPVLLLTVKTHGAGSLSDTSQPQATPSIFKSRLHLAQVETYKFRNHRQSCGAPRHKIGEYWL